MVQKGWRPKALLMLYVLGRAIQTCMTQKLEVQRLHTEVFAKLLAGQPRCKRHRSSVVMDHWWEKKMKGREEQLKAESLPTNVHFLHFH